MSSCQCQQVNGLFFFITNHASLITFLFHLITDLNCVLILNARGAEMICLHMNEPDPSCQVLFRSSEILWNLLERGNKEEVTAQLSSMECVLYVSPVGSPCFHVLLMERFLEGKTKKNHFRVSEIHKLNNLEDVLWVKTISPSIL